MTTTLAQLKALVDPLVGSRVYRDEAPETPNGPTLPYVVIRDVISRTIALSGDERAIGNRTLVQIDLFEHADVEDFALITSLEQAVNGAELAYPALRAHIQGVARLFEREPRIIHHAVTVSVSGRV